MKKFEFNLQEVFFFLILTIITVGFFSVIRPFLIDIFLAIILAILFKRPFAFFLRKFKQNNRRASLVTIVLVFFTIIIPLTFIAMMISREVSSSYDLFMSNWPLIQQYIEKLPEKADSVPAIKKVLENIDWNQLMEKINESFSSILEFTVGMVQQTFVNIGVLLIHFFIILFLLYFILLDGKRLIERIQYLVPLKDSEEKELLNKFERITDAIVFNTFLLAFLEGCFGAILFAILGIPSPFFWGMIMTFLSIIPIVGTNTVLVPMAILQIVIGNVWTGVIILVIGTGAVTINQNIIRPRLDGNKSDMHPAIMFISSMGGLVTMGIVGFLAGPMIAGVFIVVWGLFGSRYQNKLEEFNKG